MKYDREGLKIEYIQQAEVGIEWFLTDKWVTYNSHARKKTKGWSAEKKKYQKEAWSEALNKAKQMLAEEYVVSQENLLKLKNKLFAHIEDVLDQKIEKGDRPLKGIIDIRKILKIELGESMDPEKVRINNKCFDEIKVVIFTDKEGSSKDRKWFTDSTDKEYGNME